MQLVTLPLPEHTLTPETSINSKKITFWLSHLPVSLSVLLSTCQNISMSTCLTFYLSLWLYHCHSVCLTVSLSVSLSVLLSVLLSHCLSHSLSYCLTVCLTDSEISHVMSSRDHRVDFVTSQVQTQIGMYSFIYFLFTEYLTFFL